MKEIRVASESKDNPSSGNCRTTTERKSDYELVVTRKFRAPASRIFEAWTKPELLMRWWAPKSFGIVFVSCDTDAQAGGSYRFVFSHPAAEQPMAFFGKYIEVTPNSLLVWTNEEAGGNGAVTTVTFTEQSGETLVVLCDRYPTKEALDAAIASGSVCGFEETFEQLNELLAVSTR